jgi:hypothetical protein
MDLGKFNPDDFETHETVFINLLAQMYGAQGKNLNHIVFNVVVPVELVDDAKRCMYQLPLTGKAYSTDNKLVYHLLKSFLINTSGLTWIELYNATENEPNDFLGSSNYFLAQVSCLHCRAQLENSKYTKKCSVVALVVVVGLVATVEVAFLSKRWKL